ncbi:hypothetical protein C8J56DRAFT_927361 [Mycena floridula]|nr:hypothetical protein C8J56DRAFT_927361 [Mycena floridula]
MDVNEAAYSFSAYLRIASLSVALYVFLETLPSTWRFFKEQLNAPKLSISPLLFFLLQLFSISVLVVSNTGFFYSKFTVESCLRFYNWPSVFKVIQSMVSQAILGLRAFNLSQRSRRMGVILLALFLSASAVSLQWVTNFYGRTGMFDPEWGNCRSIPAVGPLGSWLYYAVAIVYDLATFAISAFYLVKYHLSTSANDLMSRLTKMMLYDGLVYFVALTAVNLVNLVIYSRSAADIRTAACSLAYCAIWIMSERLLIHLHTASRERRNEMISQAVTISQSLETAREVSKAMRQQFESMPKMRALQLSVPDFDLETMTSDDSELPEETNVSVRIERTFEIQQPSSRYELEDYSRPPGTWNSTSV